MDNITAIRNYILFLKNKHNLSITLHPLEYNSITSSPELMFFNIHDNSYCIHVKTNPALQQHCVKRQCKVLEKCNCGAYIGTCFAGVKELVYPISDGEKNIGFISVSGYQTENYKSYLQSISEQYGFSLEELNETYASLKTPDINKEEIDTLLIPLCNMLELILLKNKDKKQTDLRFAEEVVRYIKQHHNQNITSKDICEHFSCSRSYMSTEFNKYTGKSIREYINELRIEDAKSFLEHSNLSVTNIAYSVGFTDSNYFSSQFKKIVGISPLTYRKESH